MSVHLLSGLLAIVFGAVIAVATFVPLVAVSYRRNGRLSPARAIGWISLCVYVIALWTYTLIPVPATDDYACVSPQLNIVDAFADVTRYDLSGIRAILTNPAVLQFVFNVALFVPLGFLLRTMYRRGVVFATITGFCVSLLIELTQLTGVWWLFPCAYRLFDFTDLMMNTLGAAIGSLLAIAFTRRQRKTSTDAAPRVSAGRRLLGMVSDVLFLALVGGTLGVFWRLAVITLSGREAPTSWSPVEALDQWMPVEAVLVSWLPLVIQLVFVMVTGTTIGERVVLLQPAATHLPVIPTRLLRFIGGIGLYGILSAVEFPLSDFLLFAFVVASIIMVFTTKNHRGLSYVVSAAELEAGSVETASPANPKDENAKPGKAAK